ncbi:hypothetical protein ABIC32_001625 [Brevundimonas sp. 1080]|uniref:hypothetical protein n=1 Tax=Brevundimonas sp. 1080 TaxID=3156405 RepID=UPI0018EB7682
MIAEALAVPQGRFQPSGWGANQPSSGLTSQGTQRRLRDFFKRSTSIAPLDVNKHIGTIQG